jgi:predicted transport protein
MLSRALIYRKIKLDQLIGVKLMPLYRISPDLQAQQIPPQSAQLERDLHHLVEANLIELFDVRFVASEYTFSGEQPGRIDTLGIDLEGTPTIIEYKRGENVNVINQGLYYMNWLIDHPGDFAIAVQKKLGHGIEINWNHPRLIILAARYAKWDNVAVKRMGDGIELWKYIRYGDDLLHLEMVYGPQRTILPSSQKVAKSVKETITDTSEYSLDYHLKDKTDKVRTIFFALREKILAFALDEGEIIETPNKRYVSYRHGKNFCEVELQKHGLKAHLDIPLSQLVDPDNFARDMSTVGHLGTGDVEIKINDTQDIEYAIELIEQSYRYTL